MLATADVVMPWTVQRFTPLLHMDAERYAAQVKADLAWCQERHLDYAPDHYLWLTGKAGQMLRGEIPRTKQIPAR